MQQMGRGSWPPRSRFVALPQRPAPPTQKLEIALTFDDLPLNGGCRRAQSSRTWRATR